MDTEIISHSYLLELENKTDMRKITSLIWINNVGCKWEPYARKYQFTQCNNCQQFGHGSKYCNIRANCVICAGRHKSVVSLNFPERNMEDHTANYLQYIRYLQYLNVQTVKSQPLETTTT